MFGHTDLRKGVSGAKFDPKSDFEATFAVAPQKLDQNHEKLIFPSKNFANCCFRRRKMKCWESSETRFPKLSRRSEPCEG